VTDGKEISRIPQPEHDEYFHFHCSPTDDVVAVETGERLELHDVGKQRAVRIVELAAGNVWDFAFSRDGAQIVVLAWDEQKAAELIVAEVASREVLYRLKAANRWPREFALLDGGTGAVVASGDGEGIIWTLRPDGLPAGPAPREQTAEQLETWWRDLAGNDPAKAYAAIWGFTEARAAGAEFLVRRLPSTPTNNEPLMLRVGRLIAGLNGEGAQEALRRLTAMRPHVDDELEALLKTNLSPILKAQIEAILSADLERPSAAELQLCRAAQILGRIGGDAARRKLKQMQNGLPELPSTVAARRAPACLEKTIPGEK
jgi:hypothetical protein